MAADKPARRVLADEVIMLLAEHPPHSLSGMPKSRLFDVGRLSAKVADEVMAAVGRGTELAPGDVRIPPATDLPPQLQTVATLVAAWVAQQARTLSIDSALLATRNDIETFLRRVPDNPLSRGWRAELVGATVGRIVAGTAAVAFDGQGSLVLVDRSAPKGADEMG